MLAAQRAVAAPSKHMELIGERYAVQRRVCATLYGAVYVCRDRQQLGGEDNLVVVKEVSLRRAVELLDASQQHAQQLDDPRGERLVARRLRQGPRHPNLVRYLDEFIANEHLYFVVEYCAGGDLYEFTRRQPGHRLTCAEALGVIRQVASAVAFLHAQGIAHRDVSLENVLLDSQSVCKLCDFGLAVDIAQPCHDRAGKRYYMAPEVVSAAFADVNYVYDARAADVWSLGILLFVLVSGSPLVSEASADNNAFAAMAHAGVREVLVAWGTADVLWPSAVELLEGMLQVDVGRRLTIEQVVQHAVFSDLEAFVAAA